jgi:hypothetical protein
VDDRRLAPRRRRRRGLVSWPLYRLLLLVALIPPLFTVLTPRDATPPPLPARTVDFDGAAAAAVAGTLPPAGRRAAGSPGDLAAADEVGARLRELGLSVTEVPFAANVPWQDTPIAMVNVLGFRRGTSPEIVAVIAHRDAPLDRHDGDDGAAATGMLLELARRLGAQPGGRGLLFASTDGGAAGGVGARLIAQTPALGRRIVAAVVLGDMAPAGGGAIHVETRADAPRGPASALVEGARAALQQAGVAVELPGALDQVTGYAVPYARGEHGPMIARGVSAVRLTAHEAAPAGPRKLDEGALERGGAGVAALVTALQSAPALGTGGSPALFLPAKTLRAWLLEVSIVGLLVPPIACVLEVTARARRARVRLGPALRALGVRAAAWIVALATLWVLTVLPGGLVSGVAIAPVPGHTGLTAAGVAIAVLTALLFWRYVGRPRLEPRGPVGATDRTAGLVAGLVGLCGVGAVLAAVNPFSVILVLPALHAWLLVPAAARIDRRAMLAAYAAGAIGPLLVLAELWTGQGLGADAPAALVAEAASGYLSPAVALPLAVAGACAAQVGALLLGRYSPAHETGRRASRRV